MTQIKGGSTETMVGTSPMVISSLVDPFLSLAADVVDDLERTRIANENRLRQLTRTAVDTDGEERGFGLDERHPDVRNLGQIVDAMIQLEHQATLQLQRQLRRHPLAPWLKSQRGVGEKQAARLLAAIGDPYVNSATGKPRTVASLWAFSGHHVVSGGDSDQLTFDAHGGNVGVAARRRRGVRCNWSEVAKARTFLISQSMLKSGNREVYDQRRAATEGKVHASPCVRCGPQGSPAPEGSPWNDGHRHADAIRVQGKRFLKLLWREARRLHLEMETK